jgi:beta-lactamase class A
MLIDWRAGATAQFDASAFAAQVGDLEQKSGGRLGVAYLDMATGERAGHRADERFPMCSTHKFLSAAAILSQVDRGQEHLERIVHFTEQDIAGYSPATQSRVGEPGMSMGELCQAAITLSDNTAANLLLASIGGPAGWTAYVRTLGDHVTRLDRNEPTLNEALPGDPRDTTSPNAMVSDLRNVALSNALTPVSRDLLVTWLVECKTGGQRLRAGVPAEWKEGDKTGTGERGTSNDVAIFWPPKRPPILVAAYLTGSTLDDAGREGILAELGKLIAATVRG